ncbi:MAG: hypothetical protein AAGA54_28140 [Myxococcota bacterium]
MGKHRGIASVVAALALAGCPSDEGGEAFGSGGSSSITATGGDTSTGDASTSTTAGTTTAAGGEGSTSTGPAGTEGGSSSGSSSTGEGDSTSTGEDDSDTFGTTGTVEPPDPLWVTPNLWYAVNDQIHYIELDPADGSVVQLVTSTITTEMIDGQNGITMLESGGLLLSRESAGGTEIYSLPEPPTVESEIEVELLGTVPDGLRIEGLYTDCEGLVYLMDTGEDVSSEVGNRLLRFTGDYLAGDLSFEVITDLENASAPDIDDMGPGIDEDGEITDGQGFAIDSGTVYDFNYTTGTGTVVGNGGTFGVHALGGPLFDDETARFYIFNSSAELFEADPITLELSDVLVTGPASTGSLTAGHSGITGPLTECVTTLPPPG